MGWIVRASYPNCQTNIKKIIGSYFSWLQRDTYFLCDCQRMVSFRHFTYASEDIDADSPITPEKFLYETPTSGVPDTLVARKLREIEQND